MKKAVMYGAGSIGRGFIAQLFCESGYETVFVDINADLIEQLNARGSYTIRLAGNNGFREVTVEHVRGVCAQDAAAVAEEIATADLMATSVGKNVLPLIAGNIAQGLAQRWDAGNTAPLNIIVCENMLQANVRLHDLVRDQLNAEHAKLLDERAGFVETCIGRNVPAAKPDPADPLRIVAEDYTVLPVYGDCFKGEMPALRHMQPHSPFDFYIQRKLFMYNMAHATTSYIGALYGCELLADAITRPEVRYIVTCALRESAIAMSHEHGVPLEELLDFGEELVYRFANTRLGATVARTGGDPRRKLSLHDRLVGTAELCLRHGRFPAYIALGIAAGYRFDAPGDPSSGEMQTYIQTHGIEKAVQEYSGIAPEHPLFGYIVDAYGQVSAGAGFGQLTAFAVQAARDAGGEQ